VNILATEIELRRNDRDFLFQLLEAQHESSVPDDFKRIIARTKAKMEAEDVKAVLQDFEDWKNS
jgi:hypothetical protein